MQAQEPAGQKRTIPSLDGLRSLSIVLVILGHIYATTNYPHNPVTHFLAQFSYVGVQIFFVISGFLITTLLMRERERTGRIDLKGFYLRRVFRIMPASLFYITVIAVLVRPGGLLFAYTSTFCYVNLRYPWVLQHLWSLSVEEQFYLLWPFALTFAFAWRKRIGICVVAVEPILRILFLHFGYVNTIYYFPTVADSLMVGCLLVFFYPKLKTHCSWLKHPGTIALLMAFLYVCIRVSWHPWFQIYLAVLIPVCAALLLFAAVERRDRVLNNPFTSWLGVLSYSLYLWQQPFMAHSDHAWWTAFPVNLVLALACALSSWFLIERPFLRLYHLRFDSRGTSRVEALAYERTPSNI